MKHQEILKQLSEYATKVLTASPEELSALNEVIQEAKMLQQAEVEKGKSNCEPEFARLTKEIEALQKREDKENTKSFIVSLNTLLQQTQEAREAWDFERMELLLQEMAGTLEDAEKASKGPKDASPSTSHKSKPLKEKLKVFQRVNAKALKQAREQRAKREAFQLELGMKIEEIGENLSPELKDILIAHRRATHEEVKAFGNYRWLDDVLDFVPDLKERKKLLLHISETMQTAITRQKLFYRALDTYKREHPEALKSSAGKEAIKNAQELGASLLNHIPSAWLTESSRLASRIDTLCKDPGEQASIKEQAKEISQETREQEREVFRKVIEQGSLKKMDRTAFFFDLPLRSITPEMNQALMSTNEKIIERAYQIRDAGGSVEEVEESLEHIPPEFWPPAFIENLQAWRVVERELAEERAKALFEDDKINLSDIGDCLNFVLDTVGTLATLNDMAGTALEFKSSTDAKFVEAGIPCAWRDAPNVVEAITAFSETIRNGFGLGPAVQDALVREDFSGIDAERLNEIMDTILGHVNTFSNTLMNLTWGVQAVYKEFKDLPEEGFLKGDFIPVLAAVVAGIDLKQALTALGNSIKMRSKTGQMLDEAKLDHITGKSRDGGAFVRAVRNERNARNRQITQKSVDVTAKSLTFAGEVTLEAIGAAGFGAVAGLALKVTAQGVEYGGKVAFAVHDWSLAKTAKELIEQAQAGNPIARLEIMEKSGLYAKMYICHLAQTNDPLATRFVVERGITDEDLKRPAMAMKIVRELLDHADQKDETQVADNLGKVISQGLMGEGSVKVAEKLGIAAKDLSKNVVRKGKGNKSTYDATRWASEKWKPPYANAISPDNWSKNKAAAQKIGYYPQNTGIKAALEKAQKAITEAEEALSAFEKTENKREKVLSKVAKCQKVLLETRSLVMEVFPINVDGGPHDPMIAYLNDLRNLLGSESNNFDNWLLRLKIKDKDWKASKEASLNPGDWEANWKDAQSKCGLEGTDEGLLKALISAEKKHAEAATEDGKTLNALRQARIDLRDAYVTAANALKKLYAISSPFEGLRTYIDEMMAVVIRAAQENDEALNGEEWKNNPVKNPTFSSDLWSLALEAAVKEGFIPDVKDHGVGKSLKAYEKEADGLKNADDPQKRLKLRVGVMKELSRTAKALDKVIQAYKDTHSELLYYFSWMRSQAFEKAAALQEAQEKIDFALDKAFTHTAWKTSYDNAINAGAVPPQKGPSKTLYSRLESYFGKYDKRIEEAKEAAKTMNYEWADQNAEHAEKDLIDALKALTTISNAPGYRRNIKMEAYLSELHEKIMKEKAKEPFREIMFAEAREKLGTPEFRWQNQGIGGWQEVKKHADIAGLIKKANNKTGFGASIDAVLKAEAEMVAAKNPKTRKKHMDELKEALAVMEGIARSLESSTEHKGFKGYFQNARKAVEEKLSSY